MGAALELRRGHWAYPDCHDSELCSASHASLQTSSLPGSGSGSISPPPRYSTWLWVQAAHQSLKSRQCPLPRLSRTFHSCLLLWAPVSSRYQEPLHPPRAAYSYHRPMKVSVAATDCVYPGSPPSARTEWQSNRAARRRTPLLWSQTQFWGPTADEPERLCCIRVPPGLACGCGLHSPDTPTSCTSVLTQPRWEPWSA